MKQLEVSTTKSNTDRIPESVSMTDLSISILNGGKAYEKREKEKKKKKRNTMH
jgi:hypothetical protein